MSSALPGYMGSGSQLLAPPVRSAKAANIKPDLKNTGICVWGSRGRTSRGDRFTSTVRKSRAPQRPLSKGFGESRRCLAGPSGLAPGNGLPAASRGPELARQGAARGDRSSSGTVAQRRPGAPPAGSLPLVPRAADAGGGSFDFKVESCFSSFRSKFPVAAAASADPLQGLTRFYPKYHRLLDEILSAVLARARRSAREGAVRLSPHRYAFPVLYCTAFFSFPPIYLLQRVPHTRLSRLA